MANVTYLIGAGASAGKRNAAEILEGLPCVADIKRRLETLIYAFQIAKFPDDFEGRNAQLELNTLKDWGNAQNTIIEDLKKLKIICENNATIDTYAKKLRLKSDYAGLAYIERLLTFYFIIEQILLPPDSRYDTFLASVLEEGMLFPEHIKVISWNYDSQFEIAFDDYEQNFRLNIGSKINTKEDQQCDIIKINGSACFDKMEYLPIMRKKWLKKIENSKAELKTVDTVKVEILLGDIITLYKLFVFHSNPTRRNNTQLSFAFDDTHYNNAIYNHVNEIMSNTDVLVIIGYTFPFFNREIDRKILKNLKPNAKIYIQDLYPERIQQSLKAVLPNVVDENITPLKQVDQFFLPPEL